MAWCKAHFNILNHLDVWRTERQTDRRNDEQTLWQQLPCLTTLHGQNAHISKTA